MTTTAASAIPTMATILHPVLFIQVSQLLNDSAVETTSDVNERGCSSLDGQRSEDLVGMSMLYDCTCWL